MSTNSLKAWYVRTAIITTGVIAILVVNAAHYTNLVENVDPAHGTVIAALFGFSTLAAFEAGRNVARR